MRYCAIERRGRRALLRRVDVEAVRDRGGEFEVGLARGRRELLDRGLGAGLQDRVPRDAHDRGDPLGEQLLDAVEVQLALGPHLVDHRHGVGDEVGVAVLAQPVQRAHRRARGVQARSRDDDELIGELDDPLARRTPARRCRCPSGPGCSGARAGRRRCRSPARAGASVMLGSSSAATTSSRVAACDV